MARARRVFLDANVLFSAAYGSPGLRRLWDLASAGRHALMASVHVIEEARRNLAPQHLPALGELGRSLEMAPTPDPDLPCPIEVPPGDREAFLSAVAGGASHFLTGDARHFGRYFGQRIAGVWIQTPGQYLEAMRAHHKSETG